MCYVYVLLYHRLHHNIPSCISTVFPAVWTSLAVSFNTEHHSYRSCRVCNHLDSIRRFQWSLGLLIVWEWRYILHSHTLIAKAGVIAFRRCESFKCYIRKMCLQLTKAPYVTQLVTVSHCTVILQLTHSLLSQKLFSNIFESNANECCAAHASERLMSSMFLLSYNIKIMISPKPEVNCYSSIK